MTAYFNDNEPFVQPWLQNLWPDATVDGRSIVDVQPKDLEGYTRVHMFGGIGGWEYALQLADWPEDVPVWTGSCPCQPFSTAGKRNGTNDARHLWPELLRLIRECRPPVVLGEQVASKLGREWLTGVRADLEALGYAVGAADLCAAGIAAPHIRQRLFFVASRLADARRLSSQSWRGTGDVPGQTEGDQGTAQDGGCAERQRSWNATPDSSTTGGVAYAERTSPEPGRTTDQSREGTGAQGTGAPVEPGRRGNLGGVGYALGSGLEGYAGDGNGSHQPRRLSQTPSGSVAEAGSTGFWADYDFIPCLDGATRRIEPGLEPLVARLPNTVGRIRAYGGSIVPQVAAVFVKSFMEVVGL